MSSRWKQSKRAREWVAQQKKIVNQPKWIGIILGYGMLFLIFYYIFNFLINLLKIYYHVK